jgi:hypothetical protein
VTRFVVSRWKKIAGGLFRRRWERSPSINGTSACRSSPDRLSGESGPVLVPERAGRISGSLDDMIISLYAHGTSVRDNHSVQAEPAHLAVGIGADGGKHIPGIRPAKTPLPPVNRPAAGPR